MPKKLGPDNPGTGEAMAIRLNDHYRAALQFIQAKFGLESKSDAIRVCIDRFYEELEG